MEGTLIEANTAAPYNSFGGGLINKGGGQLSGRRGGRIGARASSVEPGDLRVGGEELLA